MEEYLKKYTTPLEKKKRKKRKPQNRGIKIVDDDVGWLNNKIEENHAQEIKFLLEEEKPQVVEMTRNDFADTAKWKSITNSDDEDKIEDKQKIEELRNERLDSDDSDMDIPRQSNADSLNEKRKADNPVANSDEDSDEDLDVPRPNTNKQPQMSGGGSGGLISLEKFRDEVSQKKKMDSDLQKMAENYKNTAPIRRERGTGKIVDVFAEAKAFEEKLKKKKEREEKYARWGKGLKQAEMKTSLLEDRLKEESKPFARYKDDEDLDKMLREEIREDEDPMAQYIKKKKQGKKINEESNLPKYKGPPPAPNRFGILPGYRWDGLDRSNGFESRYYLRQSNLAAAKQDYHMWSVNDM